MAISRTPPKAVRLFLRQEVGFGCPVAGCRSALLTWHHFDPPWRIEEHHRPQGMIALCRPHHDAAEAGTFSKRELQHLKTGPRTDPATSFFPWAKREFLVRLGGCYSGGMRTHVAVANNPVIQLNRSGDGLLLLSMLLRSPEGRVILEIDENMLIAEPEEVYDLEVNTGASRVRVWFDRRRVGLDLSFKRLTVDELSHQLVLDRERGEARIPQLDELMADIPAENRAMLQLPHSHQDVLASMPGLDRLPEHIREAFVSGDQVGTFVKRWAQERCVDDEGLIPTIDLDHLGLNEGGRHVEIHDGIDSGGLHMGYSAAFDNASGGFNL